MLKSLLIHFVLLHFESKDMFSMCMFKDVIIEEYEKKTAPYIMIYFLKTV